MLYSRVCAVLVAVVRCASRSGSALRKLAVYNTEMYEIFCLWGYLVTPGWDISPVGYHTIGRISHLVGCRTCEGGISKQRDISIAARISRNRDIQLQVRYLT